MAYITPPESVKTRGRALRGVANRDYEGFIQQLLGNEHLFGLYDKLVYKVCADVTQKSEFEMFYNQYYSGMFVSVDYFAVPEDKITS